MTTISRLFLRCRPPTIAGLVIAVVVWISVNGSPRRSFTHVVAEVLKLQPPLADSNAATTIAPVMQFSGIAAARQHRCPCRICPTMAHPVCRRVATITSAAGRVARPEIIRANGCHSATVAKTLPKRMAAPKFLYEPQDLQIAISTPCQILEPWVFGIYGGFRHDSLLLAGCVQGRGRADIPISARSFYQFQTNVRITELNETTSTAEREVTELTRHG